MERSEAYGSVPTEHVENVIPSTIHLEAANKKSCLLFGYNCLAIV